MRGVNRFQKFHPSVGVEMFFGCWKVLKVFRMFLDVFGVLGVGGCFSMFFDVFGRW